MNNKEFNWNEAISIAHKTAVEHGLTENITEMEKKKVELEDIAIGGTFEYNGETYLCKKTTRYKGCIGCAFIDDDVCLELPFRCTALNRKDHTEVIFVEV